MRLPSAGNYVLHQVHSGHRWGERRCEDHAFCPMPKISVWWLHETKQKSLKPKCLGTFLSGQATRCHGTWPGTSTRGNQRQLSQNPIGISVLGRDPSRIHSSEM